MKAQKAQRPWASAPFGSIQAKYEQQNRVGWDAKHQHQEAMHSAVAQEIPGYLAPGAFSSTTPWSSIFLM
jgi:hypothetical protein